MNYFHLEVYLKHGNIREDRLGRAQWRGMLYYRPLIKFVTDSTLLIPVIKYEIQLVLLEFTILC